VWNAVAVLPVLLRSSERIWLAVLPVTLTPFELRQLLKAARAELLIARLAPPAKPAGAYLPQSLNAAEFVPAKDAPGRGDPVGRALGEMDPVGRAPDGPADDWDFLKPVSRLAAPASAEVSMSAIAHGGSP